MDPHGKVIVVTGAGSGMGRELVRELVRRGARVAAVDINEATLAETAALASADGGASADPVATFTMSVADRDAVDGLPDRVLERFGSIDGLVNCAGIIQPFVRLKDLDDAAIERVMAVNWWGVLWMTRTFLPHLLARPVAHVVNVSSMGGFLPVPGQTVYGASKAAVKLLTEGLNAECSGTPVRVTVVFPGAVATNITTNSGVEIPAMSGGKTPPILPADRAARMIVDGMSRDAYRVLVGSDARLMDRLYRVDPRRATGFIAERMKSLLAG